MLQKYGVSNLKGTTNDIKKIFEQYDFIENEDYKLRNVSQFSRGGRGNKNEYYLHPRAFKICLMRSLKTKKYAKYYLLLEECIKYFNDYQNKLKEKYIIKLKTKIENKDNHISELNNQIKEILESNKRLEISNKKLEDLVNKSNSKLDEALDKLEETNNILEDTKEELEITNEKLDTKDKTLIKVAKKLDIAVEDRVIKTRKTSTLEYFVVMRNYNAEYNYYIIRGQKRYINKKVEQLEGYERIKTIECCPNATILWNLMKEKLKDNIDFCGNKLNLLNLNEIEFLTKVDNIYNKRKDVII